jgi:3-oxoacyl-[acyl-carrier protein] reductase
MKYALVTGGSRGIGKAVCIKLAGMGYHVLINYLSNKEEAQNTLQLVQQAGSQGTVLQFDVTDPMQVESVLANWQEQHVDDYIEVLVNNAGIRKDMLMMWMENNHWQDVINTNLNGFFFTSRFVLKNMLVKKYGRIVNVVSLSGLKGLPGQVNYSAAKAGVIGATKALAQEIGKKI